MIELIRTNDVVLISFIESLLKDAGIPVFVADTHMSVLEGSMGFLQRRILIDANLEDQARQLVIDAGLAHELRD